MDGEPVRVVAIQPVRDFDAFCAEFAKARGRHPELGVLGTSVHRSVDNPNEVMVTFEMRSREDAMSFLTADDRMRKWLDQAGVEVYPAVFVGRIIEGDT